MHSTNKLYILRAKVGTGENWFLGENGYYFPDQGSAGAGDSYHFSDEELAEMYEVMGQLKVLGRAN